MAALAGVSAVAVTEPGLYVMSLEEYLNDPCPEPSLNHSMAHILLARSPWHAFHAHPKLSPDGIQRINGDHFDLGTVVHELVLEGVERIVEIPAKDFRTKAAKERREAARKAGKIPLLTETLQKARAIADIIQYSVEDYPEPIPFRTGVPERVLIWQEGAIWCRARVDWLHLDFKTIDDLKTTGENGHPAEFSRKLYDKGLDLQVAFHTRGVQALFKELPDFRFLVVEDAPPHALSLIGLAPDALDFANHRMLTAIETWARCLRTGTWPGYARRVVYTDVPPWVQSRWQERIYYEEVVRDDPR